MAEILNALTMYYGLDWVALILGVSGSYMITSQNRYGFLLAGIGCICGFAVALMAMQIGYVVYNIILTGIMVRGYLSLSRYQDDAQAEPAE